MGILRGKKDKEAMDHQKNVVYAEESRTRNPMTEDYVSSLGRSVYSIIDPEVVEIIKKIVEGEKFNDLAWLVPAISHLNRMTQITNKTDLEIVKLDYDALFLEYEALRNEGDYDVQKALLTDALQIFANFIPADAWDGFKAKLLSYQMKIIRTELEEKKTKGLLG